MHETNTTRNTLEKVFQCKFKFRAELATQVQQQEFILAVNFYNVKKKNEKI